MLKNLLVPVDFSRYSFQALKIALDIALRYGSRVIILNAYHPTGYSRSGIVVADTLEEYEQKANKQLAEVLNDFPELHKVDWIFLIKAGFVVDVVKNAMLDFDADLIVMGTQGATGLKEIILGSKTAEIISDAICPVLAVPLMDKQPKFDTITIAYDGKEFINKTEFRVVSALVDAYNSKLEVVHIKESEEAELEAEAFAEQLKARIFPDREIAIEHLNGEGIERTLNEYVESHQVDLLVMIHRRRGLFSRLFNTSISKKLTYHSDIPLFIINEREAVERNHSTEV